MSPLPPVDDRPEAFEARGQITAAEFNGRLVNQVRRIRKAEEEYRRAILEWAEAERVYKRAQAFAFVQITDAKNAGERDARAELMPLADGGTINDLRFDAHNKEGLVNAAKLSLQNRASELSALQSEASLAKEEARFANYAPSEVVGP